MTDDADLRVAGRTPSGALVYHPSEEVRREREQRWLACRARRDEKRRQRAAEKMDAQPASLPDSVYVLDAAIVAERVARVALIITALLAVVSLGAVGLAAVVLFGS